MKNYVTDNISDFDLEQTLECGQCFHFIKLGEKEYNISAKGHVLHVLQEDKKLVLFDTDEKEYEQIWKHYFDLDRDYSKIKSELLKKDDKLSEAIESMHGVRILNQDFFETMISFIISQNQQIPRIKNIVASISDKYGTVCGKMSLFPDAKAILKAGETGMMECKAGFRAKYIIDACEKYDSGEICENDLYAMDYGEVIAKLKSVKGIGNKVANCITLFSLEKRNAFPVDVWIKRIMENMYFHKDTPVELIESFAKEHFGELGGYAQQYLFYYGKTMKIGK